MYLLLAPGPFTSINKIYLNVLFCKTVNGQEMLYRLELVKKRERERERGSL